MRYKIFFIILFSVLTQALAQDNQISFIAEVSKNSLGINENLRVDFKMNQDGDNFNAPNFDGFRVVGGPNQSVSNMWVNGERTFSKVYSYYLTPIKKGKLSIGQATIEINNKIYKTIPVKVTVSGSASIIKNPDDPSYVVNDNLHLVAEVSKVNPYLNEGFSVVYKLFFSPQINVTNVGEIDSPKYSDFWSHNIKIPRLQIERGTYKGESYNFVIWKKIVLYPQKTGELNILPLTLDVSVDVPTNKRDFFGNRIYSQLPKTVTAGKKTINVLELPSNQPENFSGAVGNFDIELSTNKSELNASESVQAKIKISGTGNLKLFSIPDLTVPSSIEKYEPEYADNVKTNIKGMYGSISNTYTLVPQFKGKFPISPIEFVYFDPLKKTYKSIKSSQTIIDVIEGPNSFTSNNNDIPLNNNFNNISSSRTQFKFINTNPNLVSIEPYVFIYSNYFYILLFLPVIFFIGLFFFNKKSKNNKSDLISQRANKLAKKYLSEAKINLKKKDIFYVALERALHNFLKSKFSIESSDYTKVKIRNLLKQKNVNTNTVNLFLSLIENCEYARFTPSSDVAISRDYENAVTVISEIDKQI
tara:strand:- start:8504 stop:10264 length:1761 start_codon:yes stop_codon:yes gene_type:complete